MCVCENYIHSISVNTNLQIYVYVPWNYVYHMYMSSVFITGLTKLPLCVMYSYVYTFTSWFCFPQNSPVLNWSWTSLLSPPHNGSPQQTTVLSASKAAKAKLVDASCWTSQQGLAERSLVDLVSLDDWTSRNPLHPRLPRTPWLTDVMTKLDLNVSESLTKFY